MIHQCQTPQFSLFLIPFLLYISLNGRAGNLKQNRATFALKQHLRVQKKSSKKRIHTMVLLSFVVVLQAYVRPQHFLESSLWALL